MPRFIRQGWKLHDPWMTRLVTVRACDNAQTPTSGQCKVSDGLSYGSCSPHCESRVGTRAPSLAQAGVWCGSRRVRLARVARTARQSYERQVIFK